MKLAQLSLGVALFGLTCSLAQAEVTIKESDAGYAVSINGQPFTVYKHKDLRVPCFYPIHGPNGVPMTRKYPLEDAREGEAKDHPHHTSLWYTHGDVNGLDFWHGGGKQAEKGGKIVHDKLVSKEDGEQRAVLKTTSKWLSLVGEKEICQDSRTVVFGTLGDNRYIDFEITIKATNGDVVFGDTKEGSMSIRTHPNLRLKGEVANGKAVNSAGDKDKDLWGKAAKWVDYWGTIDEEKVGVTARKTTARKLLFVRGIRGVEVIGIGGGSALAIVSQPHRGRPGRPSRYVWERNSRPHSRSHRQRSGRFPESSPPYGSRIT